MNLESDPKKAIGIRLLSQGCKKILERLFREEEAQNDAQVASDGYWASRQFSEFNIWCVKVGINGLGLRSVDVRLKDVPETCDMIRGLLQSLDQDLQRLQEPFVETLGSNDKQDEPSDSDTDSSSLSFDSLSSLGKMAAQTLVSECSDAEKRRHDLQGHIEETIDRLHGHALQIDRAGDAHRQERLKRYMCKERSKFAYDGYMELAYRNAKIQFPDATEIFQKRMAESFARRRIRFDYLSEHQHKRAIEDSKTAQAPAIETACIVTEENDVALRQPLETKDPEASTLVDITTRQLADQRTIYSATEDTKLEVGPSPRRRERPETVASVALRHADFPPRPRVNGGSFRCPYCRLDFRASEAQHSRWSQHVMQDFEPYFCIFEICQTPFDVPNTFDGLLNHLQDHMEERFHVDLPCGGHEDFDEKGFESHLVHHGDHSLDYLDLMKETSRRRSALILDKCPFCGGYPDEIEERYPEWNTHAAQTELRKHIKRHMHDFSLFLPPYRDDVPDRNDFDAVVSSPSHDEASVNSLDGSEDIVMVCERNDCDCKYQGEHDDLERFLTPLHPDNAYGNTEGVDFWRQYFPEMPQYSTSLPTEEDYLKDRLLSEMAAARQSPAPDPVRKETTPEEIFAMYKTALRDNLALRTPGTSQWLLDTDEFRGWVAGRRKSLICFGIPGSGKTVVSSMVVQHLHDQFRNDATIGVAFVYRSYKHHGPSDNLDLLRTIIGQLAQRPHSRLRGLDFKSLSSACLYNLSYDGLLEELSWEFDQCSRAFIVVDAIDSDTHDLQDSMISELASHMNVHLFFSARNIPEHLSKLRNVTTMEVRATESDLRAYTKHRLQNSSLRDVAKLQANLEAWVLDISDGMFLVAKLSLDYVETIIGRSVSGGESIYHILDLISEGRQIQLTKLDDIYKDSMLQISFLDEEMPAMDLLSWVTFAQRPLNLAELSSALNQTSNHRLMSERYDILAVVTICSGLLRVQTGGVVVPIHHTSQEYLTRTQQDWRTVSEAAMAAACAMYLEIHCPTEYEAGYLVADRALYNYAAVNWGHHARVASCQISAVTDFLQNEPAVWAASQELGRNILKLPTGIMGLHLSAYFGVSEGVDDLLKIWPVDVQDDSHMTPLMYSVKNGHESFTGLLLAHGANPNMKEERGMAALHFAASNDQEGLARMLLRSGARVDILSNEKLTPLLTAVLVGSEGVVKVLVESGARADVFDQFGRTPLKLAEHHANEAVIRLLLAGTNDNEGRQI